MSPKHFCIVPTCQRWVQPESRPYCRRCARELGLLPDYAQGQGRRTDLGATAAIGADSEDLTFRGPWPTRRRRREVPVIRRPLREIVLEGRPAWVMWDGSVR